MRMNTTAQEKRLAFWNLNRMTAMILLGQPDLGSIEGRMVVIADMQDSVGKPFAETLSEVKGVDAAAHIRKVENKGQIPTAVMVLPIEAVAKILEEPNPTIAGVLRKSTPAEGYLWVAIIAEEGTLIIQTPFEPITTPGVS